MLLTMLSKEKAVIAGGHKAGDTVFSTVSKAGKVSTGGKGRRGSSVGIKPGSQGVVIGPCDDQTVPDAHLKLVVTFESGPLTLTMDVSTVSKFHPVVANGFGMLTYAATIRIPTVVLTHLPPPPSLTQRRATPST